MGAIAAAARELIAAGVTGDALVTALERIEQHVHLAADAAAEKRRAYDRQRKRDERERLRMSAESTDKVDTGSPDKESAPHTPLKEINPSRSFGARDPVLEREFEETFWPAYPHKVGKPEALTAFIAARQGRRPRGKPPREPTPLARIMAGLEAYSNKTDDRPWLNPATFLNGNRFDDQPADPPVPTGKSRPHDAIFRALAEQSAPGFGLGRGQADAHVGVHDHAGPAPPTRGETLELAAGDYRRSG